MPTLAQQLGMTAPVSLLKKKAERLGILCVEQAMGLAVARGCRHYASVCEAKLDDPGQHAFSDEDLVLYLISGNHAYNLMAIRCAAQLMRSTFIEAQHLAFGARKYCVERILLHIARAGFTHDENGKGFWQMILDELSDVPRREEEQLPHWTRFVSMSGFQRGGQGAIHWLTPQA